MKDLKNRLNNIDTKIKTQSTSMYLQLTDIISKGKYKDCVVQDIVEQDPSYLRYMHENAFMFFDDEVEQEITWSLEKNRDNRRYT